MTLLPNPESVKEITSGESTLNIARIECHFALNNFFMPTDNYLLENAYLMTFRFGSSRDVTMSSALLLQLGIFTMLCHIPIFALSPMALIHPWIPPWLQHWWKDPKTLKISTDGQYSDLVLTCLAEQFK